MTSVFTRIIQGELPGHFVWSDEDCVAFLTIEPLAPGHCLVVPREEIDHWVDLPAQTSAHLFRVAQKIGAVLRQEFDSKRAGLMIQGFEVPHTHLHVWPTNSPGDFDLSRTSPASAEELSTVAERIRVALGTEELGTVES